MLSTSFIVLKKSKKFKLKYIETYKVLECIGLQAYKLALPPSLAKLYDFFYVLLLHHYCHGSNK